MFACKRVQAGSYQDCPSILEILEWETIEFAYSPKWDKCFDDNKQGIHAAASTEEREDIKVREAAEDRKLQEHWLTINPRIIEKATHVLLPFVMPNGWEWIQSVLQQQTQNTLFCPKILPILPISGHVHEHHWKVLEFKITSMSTKFIELEGTKGGWPPNTVLHRNPGRPN